MKVLLIELNEFNPKLLRHAAKRLKLKNLNNLLNLKHCETFTEEIKEFDGLDPWIQWPSIPITSNVDGQFYPNSGEDAKSSVLQKLAPQMASPVEWTKQIQTMYDAGARVFLEVGPKRALTVFASQILEENPHLALNTNHHY